MEQQVSREALAPPYVSFHTFMGFIEKMEPPGIVPTQIDSTFLKSYAGSVQRLLLQALKSLRLIEQDSGRVRESLKLLVTNKNERPALIRQLLDQHYPWALSLDQNSTEQNLIDAFGEYGGVEGDTRRKAMAFFLAAADYAKVSYSPLWKKSRGRPAGSSGAVRRSLSRRTKKGGKETQELPDNGQQGLSQPGTSKDQMTALYFELLLEKARKGEQIDRDLADRMEAIIGVQKPTAPAPDGNAGGIKPEEGGWCREEGLSPLARR